MICIKYLDENNKIYGVDTSDLTIRETRLTEVFKSHIYHKNNWNIYILYVFIIMSFFLKGIFG